MIRADRVLLAELARLNGDMAPTAMRLMDGSLTADEHRTFADRLRAAGQRLAARAADIDRVIIDGDVVPPSPDPGDTSPDRER